MPSSFLRDSNEITTVARMFAEARQKHGAAALSRLERGFAIATGMAPPVPSPHPLQRPGLYLPDIPSRPFFDPTEIPGVAALERNWKTIRDEMLAIVEARRGFQRHVVDRGLERGDRWNALYLRQEPLSFDENRAACPETVRVVESVARLGEMVMFSALNPGAHILPHCGPWNARLTVHLGLTVPEGCVFRVGSEVRTWQEGRCLAFDDSFEHEVLHRGQSTRVILLLDVWHPELTAIEIEVLSRARNLISANMKESLALVERGRNDLSGTRWWKQSGN